MQSFISRLALVTLASTSVLAEVAIFGVPAIIKPGQPFNATFEYADEQPNQNTVFWGYWPYDDNTGAVDMPQHNTVGIGMVTVSLSDYITVTDDGYGGNITGLVVNGNVGDKVGVHAMIWGVAGVREYAVIDSWLWNVTLGDSTSYDNYVMAEKGNLNGPQFKRFDL